MIEMNSSDVIYFLNNLKNDIGSVSNVIYIERVIDLIKLNATLEKDNFESNCIIDWELYHKMKGGDYKIDTEYKFNQKPKNTFNRDEVREMVEKSLLGDIDLTEYFIDITEAAKEGKTFVVFENMKPEVLVSLESLKFSVEWFEGNNEKGWMVKW